MAMFESMSPFWISFEQRLDIMSASLTVRIITDTSHRDCSVADEHRFNDDLNCHKKAANQMPARNIRASAQRLAILRAGLPALRFAKYHRRNGEITECARRYRLNWFVGRSERVVCLSRNRAQRGHKVRSFSRQTSEGLADCFRQHEAFHIWHQGCAHVLHTQYRHLGPVKEKEL